MKIRRKSCLSEMAIVKHSYANGYLIEDSSGQQAAFLSKTDWEEVPEVVDVEMAEVNVAGRHVILPNGQWQVAITEGYEWRKVEVYEIPDIDVFNRDFMDRKCSAAECLSKYKTTRLKIVKVNNLNNKGE